MPQAPQELRDEWGVMDDLAINFLLERGFKYSRDFVWNVHRKPTDEEFSALQFLLLEWDFDFQYTY
tara:strand:+ start:2016 stop:2213 length:198 start_codon:yes stop_codon:yes gene_type:complete